MPATGAAPVLGHRRADRVVVQPHRDAEQVGEPRPEREVPPARDVHRRDLAGRPAHRPAAAHPGRHHRQADPAEHVAQQGRERRPQRLRVRPLRRRPHPWAQHHPGRQHHRGGQLGPADVHREHRPGFRHQRNLGPGLPGVCGRPAPTYGRRVTSAPQISTLGELRASGHVHRSVKAELRDNLLARLAAASRACPAWSASRTPSCPRSSARCIAGHDLVLLGERGQGKTRLIRTLVGLLDEWTPVLVGSELNEHPLHPISRLGAPADRRARRRRPRRLAAPQRPVRREAGHAGHQRRRPDRRRRPDQGGRGPHAGRPGDRALRAGPAHQPRHLQRQRAARPGRADPGGAAQRAGGARHPDPRLPGAAAAGPAARGQRQPRGLHQPRPDHHPAQGPLRRRGAHPLPARARRRDPAAAPGGARLRGPAARTTRSSTRSSPSTWPRSSPASPGWSASPATSTSAPGSAPGSPSPGWRRSRPPPSAGPRSPARPGRWPGSCDLPSVVPANRGKVEFADSGADPDDEREVEVLEHLLRQATAQTFRARLRRAGPDRAAGALHRRGDGRVRRAGAGRGAARPARHASRSSPSCWAASACPEGEQSAEQAAAAVEFALEGLYLTRRLAKDTTARRTVYGA